MRRPIASRVVFVPSPGVGPDFTELLSMPGGPPGQASSVTQKNTIPTASRPTMPPTTIASLVFPDISFLRTFKESATAFAGGPPVAI